jgi:hypothetical protein
LTAATLRSNSNPLLSVKRFFFVFLSFFTRFFLLFMFSFPSISFERQLQFGEITLTLLLQKKKNVFNVGR